MDNFNYTALVLQKCFAKRYGIALDKVSFSKKLGNDYPEGYGFNANSLRSFIDYEVTREIQEKFKAKVIHVDKGQANRLVGENGIQLIAFVAKQL